MNGGVFEETSFGVRRAYCLGATARPVTAAMLGSNGARRISLIAPHATSFIIAPLWKGSRYRAIRRAAATMMVG
ncbi:hypothetical protein [Caballeronia ptereochthonis]|jgi:hypothetical protein|uniref:hypothetical protein n=1 Tax=Caballeronia ptereochthonis TaxID=1777144 RepID=UPI000B30CF51|nr:hypothetical protein [Caballeronia ptereochthonis]